MHNQANYNQIISMEEYLNRRQAIREKEELHNQRTIEDEYEKSSAMMLAELYI